MDTSNWIAISGLLVSLAILFRLFYGDRREKIQNRKAIIRAQGFKSGQSWVVRIWNDGTSIAKNVRLKSDDIDNDSGIALFIKKGILPYPLLNYGDSFEIVASLDEGRNPVPIIKLIWDDEYKKDNEREQVLSFI